MSMLTHGFVDSEHTTAFEPDESDPMSYGVGSRDRRRPVATVIGFVVVIVVLVAGRVVFG